MPKRVLTGTVVSDKGDKTVVVRVERRVKHPLYGKIIKLSKKYHAHDAANEFRVGEIVRIEECAPISKLKTWKVVDRIGTAKIGAVEIDEPEMVAAPRPSRRSPPRKRPRKPAKKRQEGQGRRRRRSGRLRRDLRGLGSNHDPDAVQPGRCG